MNRWTAVELQNPSALAPGAGAFSAVAHVTAAGTGPQQGTAFMIHPALLVTAAHVVTYRVEGRMWVAGRIDIDFGQARVGIWRLAIPLEYIASLGRDGRWDLAVLRLPDPLGNPAVALSVERPPREGSRFDAVLWGNPEGERRTLRIQAVSEAGKVRFPAAASLPGWSGGPAARPATQPEGSTAIGVHRFWNETDRQGEAVPLDPALLHEAIEAIRNLDQTEGG
jgi:hypothetical protein